MSEAGPMAGQGVTTTEVTARRFQVVAPVAAVLLGVLTVVLGLASVPLDTLTHQAGTGGPAADWVSAVAGVIPAAAVGTLLAVRRPRNPIGWLLLAFLVLAFSPTGEYDVLDYRMHHGTLPLGWVAVVLQECWPVFLVVVAILLWVFPDGKLPPGRWRRLSVILVAGGVLLALAVSARGVIAAAGRDIRITPDGDLANPESGVFRVLAGIFIVVAVASWIAWVAFQVPGYRRASGERRQQLKWLYSGAAVFLAALLVTVFIAPVAMGEGIGYGTQPVVNDVGTLASGALPVCLGVAVLKYRLYAIDRIISRVISYAVVTAVLASAFAGLVVLATQVLPFKTPVAVAASTLVVAALFNPLRKRVQRVVDRRFNRARYDADQMMAAFAARLQDAMDLDSVRDDLAGVVQQALEPVHVSVWMGEHS